MALRRFIIERDIPKVGSLERAQLREPLRSRTKLSTSSLRTSSGSRAYVAEDKTFCVYLADQESTIHKHAQMSGFPATKITEVRRIIDPTTARPS